MTDFTPEFIANLLELAEKASPKDHCRAYLMWKEGV